MKSDLLWRTSEWYFSTRECHMVIWLRMTSMIIETFQLSYHVFVYALEISSLFGKSFLFLFLFFVLSILWYFPFHVETSNYSGLFIHCFRWKIPLHYEAMLFFIAPDPKLSAEQWKQWRATSTAGIKRWNPGVGVFLRNWTFISCGGSGVAVVS